MQLDYLNNVNYFICLGWKDIWLSDKFFKRTRTESWVQGHMFRRKQRNLPAWTSPFSKTVWNQSVNSTTVYRGACWAGGKDQFLHAVQSDLWCPMGAAPRPSRTDESRTADQCPSRSQGTTRGCSFYWGNFIERRQNIEINIRMTLYPVLHYF